LKYFVEKPPATLKKAIADHSAAAKLLGQKEQEEAKATMATMIVLPNATRRGPNVLCRGPPEKEEGPKRIKYGPPKPK
jgi:hypothetical protein